ncbi:MAG: endospore germination permease [Clostridia bacterium]|nr:endospore germination permease [Clostridia bacterium]
MEREKKIGTFGAVSLLTGLITAKIFLSAPAFYARHSAGAGWIEVLISGVFELFILAIILKLMNAFPEMDIIDVSEYSFGCVGRAVVGFVCSALFLLSSAAVFRCFCEMIRNCIIESVSYEYVALFIAAAVVAAAYLGWKTTLHLNNLIFPLVLISVGIVLLISVSRYDVQNIKPILGYGAKTLASNALLKNSSYYEIGALLLFIPYLSGKNHVKKIGFTALSFSIILLSGITLLYHMAVPYEAAGTFELPFYQMTRMLKAGSFIQRMEPLNIFIWAGALFVYIGMGVSLSAHAFKKAARLENETPMVFVLTFIMCIAALLPDSETTVETIYDFLLTYGYIAYPIAPLVLLILCRLVTMGRRGKNA